MTESFASAWLARHSWMIPMRALKTMTQPKRVSWKGATNHITTHIDPMRKLNQVSVFARMMLLRLRLCGSGASLVWPRAIRSSTSAVVSPSSVETVIAACRPAGAG